ncbi:uncharacterized protein LOC107426353 isoform X1 [Ziziphus jujuba]|uniref:Uncharacterized protein LOC107426353 isoform X1 n=1 Tax=Ziziphus jujuba TaxID=326968 RepID=A0A6P4B109_ZIZJJ|nr:uncharacterized protein LOC107426353 isoform X1 [Ziziphus jujuba]
MEKRSRSEAKKKTGTASGGYGGGGIGGLIVVGGALAITGLVAAFTIIKKRRKDVSMNSSTKPNHPSKDPTTTNNNNSNPKTEDQENQGLLYLVQTSSLCLADPEDSTTSATVNSCELIPPTPSLSQLVQEEKSITEIDGGEQISDILLSGDSHEENIQGDDDKNYFEERTIPLETPEGEKKENEASLSALEIEDALHMHAVEDKEGDDNEKEDKEEEEDIMEKVEENSEGTGQSSIELNTDTVWPAESIEGMAILEEEKQAERIAEKHETSKAGKQDYLNRSSNDNVHNDDCDPNEQKRKELKAKLWQKNETLAIKEATVNSSKLRVWFLSMLMLVLLLLSFSFAPHKALSMVLSLFSDIQSTVTNRSR